MDIQPFGTSAAASVVSALAQSTAAARQQAAPLVQSLIQSRQAVAAAGLTFANQSLQTALVSANAVSLLGGDGKSVLRQARGALAAAAGAIKQLANGIASGAASGATSTGDALQQLNNLDLVVGTISGTANAVIDSASTTRVLRREHGRDPDVATIRADLGAMSQAVAGSTSAVLDVTV